MSIVYNFQTEIRNYFSSVTNFCNYNEIPSITLVKTSIKCEKHLNKYYENKLKFKLKKKNMFVIVLFV